MPGEPPGLPGEAEATEGAASAAEDAGAVGSDEIRRLVSSAVNKQVTPLRIQLEEFKEERRFQDVLGGIGYLLGMAGIAFYFLGVRRRRPAA